MFKNYFEEQQGKNIKTEHKSKIYWFPNRNGRISTSRLNTLQYFHLMPINVVIFHESHNDT